MNVCPGLFGCLFQFAPRLRRRMPTGQASESKEKFVKVANFEVEHPTGLGAIDIGCVQSQGEGFSNSAHPNWRHGRPAHLFKSLGVHTHTRQDNAHDHHSRFFTR